MRLILFPVFVLAGLLLASSGLSELYKYVDDNGVVRYTDDLADVPVDQRQDAQTIGEVGGAYEENSDPVGNENVKEASDEPELDEATLERLKRTKAELDQEYAELQEESQKLREERDRLLNRAYNKQLYEEKVSAFNKKIKDFERRRNAFEAEASRYETPKENSQ